MCEWTPNPARQNKIKHILYNFYIFKVLIAPQGKNTRFRLSTPSPEKTPFRTAGKINKR